MTVLLQRSKAHERVERINNFGFQLETYRLTRDNRFLGRLWVFKIGNKWVHEFTPEGQPGVTVLGARLIQNLTSRKTKVFPTKELAFRAAADAIKKREKVSQFQIKGDNPLKPAKKMESVKVQPRRTGLRARRFGK